MTFEHNIVIHPSIKQEFLSGRYFTGSDTNIWPSCIFVFFFYEMSFIKWTNFSISETVSQNTVIILKPDTRTLDFLICVFQIILCFNSGSGIPVYATKSMLTIGMIASTSGVA